MKYDNDVLYEEWKNIAKDVNVEKFSISISELVSWYKPPIGNPKLKLSPIYQRFYRWSNFQKSEFIESLLLGIPIPPLFLYRNNDEKRFEVMDGLQRISTILEFVGVLNTSEQQTKIQPLEKLTKLEKTPFLKSLYDKEWKDFLESGLDFTFLGRSLDFIVLDSTKNDKSLKYKIFRRLNKSSSTLQPQEVRNAVIAEIDENLYKKIISFFDNNKLNFLSESDLAIRKDMELFISFLLIKYYITISKEEVLTLKKDSDNFRELLDSFMELIFNNKDFIESGLKDFELFIDITSTEGFGFKKYDLKKEEFKGLFVSAYFEIAVTIYFLKKNLLFNKEFLIKIFSISYSEWCKKISKNNPPAIVRIFEAIQYGEKIINEEER